MSPSGAHPRLTTSLAPGPGLETAGVTPAVGIQTATDALAELQMPAQPTLVTLQANVTLGRTPTARDQGRILVDIGAAAMLRKLLSISRCSTDSLLTKVSIGPGGGLGEVGLGLGLEVIIAARGGARSGQAPHAQGEQSSY
jgi:hypothetical protein